MRRIYKPLKLPVAENPKPIMAEITKDGTYRPRGGGYFRPYLKKFRHSHIALLGPRSRCKGKKVLRRAERRRAKTIREQEAV